MIKAQQTYLDSSYTEGFAYIGCESKRDFFGHPQGFALFEADVIVDVHHVSCLQIDEHVVQVSIAQSNNITWKKSVQSLPHLSSVAESTVSTALLK